LEAEPEARIEGRVDVWVDGRKERAVVVSGLPRLHTVARFPRLTQRELGLRFTPGLEAYAFTFG
jgi:Thioredoxin like C-terminal domain